MGVVTEWRGNSLIPPKRLGLATDRIVSFLGSRRAKVSL